MEMYKMRLENTLQLVDSSSYNYIYKFINKNNPMFHRKWHTNWLGKTKISSLTISYRQMSKMTNDGFLPEASNDKW